MVEGKKSNKKIEETPKKIDELIDFLRRFLENSTNKNDDKIQIDAKGHIVWKEKLKPKAKNKGKEVKEDASKDGEGKYREDLTFASTEFKFEDSSFLDLGYVIKAKLRTIRKQDEKSFQINEKLPQGSYGYENDWKYDILTDYLNSLTSSFTSNYKKNLIEKDKKGHKKVKEGTSSAVTLIINDNGMQEEATFINLLNVKSTIAKNRGKIIVDLDKKIKTQRITKDLIILEPDVFNCAIFGNKLFVFNSAYFFYMFVPRSILLKEIEARRGEMDKSLVNAEKLISYAEKMPSHTRDLYYFVAKGSAIPDRNTIEHDIKLIRDAGVKNDIFRLDQNDKLICDDKNAGLVLSYISRKLGLRISDKRLLNVEAYTSF